MILYVHPEEKKCYDEVDIKHKYNLIEINLPKTKLRRNK